MISLLYFLVAGKERDEARHRNSSVLTFLASVTTFCQAGRRRERDGEMGEKNEILTRHNDQDVQ